MPCFCRSRRGEMGEFSPLFFSALFFLFFFLSPQPGFGSITLLQKFTPISKSWIRACFLAVFFFITNKPNYMKSDTVIYIFPAKVRANTPPLKRSTNEAAYCRKGKRLRKKKHSRFFCGAEEKEARNLSYATYVCLN